MTTREINAMLALRGLTHKKIADDIKEPRSAVSQAINYLRAIPRVRTKIAVRLGMPEAELWEDLGPIRFRTPHTAGTTTADVAIAAQ